MAKYTALLSLTYYQTVTVEASDEETAKELMIEEFTLASAESDAIEIYDCMEVTE